MILKYWILVQHLLLGKKHQLDVSAAENKKKEKKPVTVALILLQ